MARKGKPDLDAVDRHMARKPIDDGGYAFPVPMVHDGVHTETVNERGMSLREYFAAHAPVTVLNGTTPEALAASAFAWADAMLEQRKNLRAVIAERAR
jgi:hypothetical protein